MLKNITRTLFRQPVDPAVIGAKNTSSILHNLENLPPLKENTTTPITEKQKESFFKHL